MKPSRFDSWFLILIFSFNLGLRIFRLNSPNIAYFDEAAYYLPAAREYLAGNFAANFEHPPLAKLFMAAGVFIFGDNPWGWRIPEVLVGTTGIVFIYLLARRMFIPKTPYSSSERSEPRSLSFNQLMGSRQARTIIGSRFVPVLASVFLTFEFAWFTHSRLAVLEIYVATFSLAAAYFFWRFFKEESIAYLVLAASFFGLAVASKWNGLFLLILAALFYLWFKRDKIFPALTKMSLMVLIVALVYLVSYTPYLTNHTLGSFTRLQVKMIDYHRTDYNELARIRAAQNSIESSDYYYTWSWALNPIQSFYNDESSGLNRFVVFLYNPILLWGSLAAIAVSLLRRPVREEKLFLISGFLVFWLPWFLPSRIGFPYYLLAGMPFGILLLSSVIKENFEKKKFFMLGIISLVIALFVFYYPLLSAVDIPNWYLKLVTGTQNNP